MAGNRLIPLGGGLTVALVLGMALGASAALAQSAPPALVKVDSVREEPLSQTVPVIGRLVARESGVVSARVGGPVFEVRAHVGDRVQRGDIIAVLADEAIAAEVERREAELNMQQANLAAVQAQLGQTQQELARLTKLKSSAAFSQARFDDTSQEVARYKGLSRQAKAQIERAAAELRLAQIDLQRTAVRAPFPGVVTIRHTSPGAYLNAGEPVVTLLNDRDLEIEADVPADRVEALTPGVSLVFALEDETRHTATVRAVVPDENPLTRTRQVRFTPEFGQIVRPLAANQSVVVELPIGPPRRIVSVHKDAVINRQGKALVFVVVDDAAQMRPVQLGESLGNRFEVLGGLHAGDLVVVRGNERLRAGQKLQVERDS
jgi:RND family efflux transporter MFP subunit